MEEPQLVTTDKFAKISEWCGIGAFGVFMVFIQVMIMQNGHGKLTDFLSNMLILVPILATAGIILGCIVLNKSDVRKTRRMAWNGIILGAVFFLGAVGGFMAILSARF